MRILTICLAWQVNPIIGLLENYSAVPVAAQSSGISYDELIFAIVSSAMRRSPNGSLPKKDESA